MAVTSSNLNQFPKFFYQWKESEVSNKTVYHFTPHRKYVAALHWELKSSNLSQIWKKMHSKMPHKPVKFPELSEETRRMAIANKTCVSGKN